MAAVLEILCLAIYVYYWVLLLRVILSLLTMVWSPPAALDPVVRVLYDLTEPVLGLLRRYVPPIGGLDLSPLIVFFGLIFIQEAICG